MPFSISFSSSVRLDTRLTGVLFGDVEASRGIGCVVCVYRAVHNSRGYLHLAIGLSSGGLYAMIVRHGAIEMELTRQFFLSTGLLIASLMVILVGLWRTQYRSSRSIGIVLLSVYVINLGISLFLAAN